MRLYNEHFYKDFDNFIKKIEHSESILKISTKFGFSDNDVRKRIVQVLVHNTFVEYCNIYKSNITPNFNSLQKNNLLKLSGFTYNFETNILKISIKVFFLSLFKSLIIFLIQLYELSKLLFFKKRIINNDYLLMLDPGTIDLNSENDISSFLFFCETGDISFLKNDFIIFKSNIKLNKNFKNLKTSSNPVICALNDQRVNRFDIIELLIKTFLIYIKTLFTSFRLPLFSIVSFEFVKTPLIFYLNKKRLLNNIVFTTSSMHSQPIWTRPFTGKNFTTHFINYSNNNVSFCFKDNPINYNYPLLRHIHVDEQWVWDKEQGNMYFNLGHYGKINIVGPILFYSQNFNYPKTKSKKIKFALFDITPILPKYISNMACIHYYYTTNIVISFLEDILVIVDQVSRELGVEIEVVLKNKRAYKKSFNDPEYLLNIEKLENKYNNFSTSKFSSNLFSLINCCDATITIPYSSVAYVSSYLGVPAIFYDPSGNLLMPDSTENVIKNINDKEKLNNEIRQIVTNKKLNCGNLINS